MMSMIILSLTVLVKEDQLTIYRNLYVRIFRVEIGRFFENKDV